MSALLAPMLIAALALLSASGAATACESGDPAAAAKAFYTQHAKFYLAPPAQLKGIITPQLLAALEREYQCAQGELCAIESVPWTDAQDGDIGQPITFQSARSSATQASVRMSYFFILSTVKRRQSVTLELQRRTAGSCWLVADVRSPTGQSLLAHIERWHKKYGNQR